MFGEKIVKSPKRFRILTKTALTKKEKNTQARKQCNMYLEETLSRQDMDVCFASAVIKVLQQMETIKLRKIFMV